jgi:hypothetical protein
LIPQNTPTIISFPISSIFHLFCCLFFCLFPPSRFISPLSFRCVSQMLFTVIWDNLFPLYRAHITHYPPINCKSNNLFMFPQIPNKIAKSPFRSEHRRIP